jgi:serralysin
MATSGTVGELALFQVYGYWDWKGDGEGYRLWSDASNVSVNISALSLNEKHLARTALQTWEDVANIHFTFTTGTADITFHNTGPKKATTVDTVSHHELQAASITITSDFYPNPDDAGNYYSYLYQSYVHEIGHAIGLGHQGKYNGADANYGTNNVYTNDTWQYAVMSYFTQSHYDSGSTRYVMTPQMADILAAILEYGASDDTRTGDTTYGFHSNAGDLYNFAYYYSGAPAFTVYDSGGIDTLDTSYYSQAQTINLASGSFSSIGGFRNNIGIYLNTKIENAVGGTGADVINGNELANVLDGGLGNDTLNGGADADRLYGGPGGDKMTGGGGGDTYFVDNITDVVSETKAGERDVVFSSISYTLPLKVEVLTLLETGAINGNTSAEGGTIFGNSSSNRLTGSAVTDTLYGLKGADVLIGKGGADHLFGGDGIDTVNYAASTAGVNVDLALNTAQHGGDAAGDVLSQLENVIGSSHNDTLRGTGVSNVLSGGAGNDVMYGRGGNDTLTGGTGLDTLFGAAGKDVFDFNTTRDSVSGANRDRINDFVHGGAQADKIDLRDIDADTHHGGNQAFHFIGSQAFSSHGSTHVYGELRYANHTLQGDVNGNGSADFEIHVNRATLFKGDFLL